MNFDIENMSLEELEELEAQIKAKLDKIAAGEEEPAEEEAREGEDAPAEGEETPAEGETAVEEAAEEITEAISSDIDELAELVEQIEGRKKILKAEKRSARAAQVAAGIAGNPIKTNMGGKNEMNNAEERARKFFETKQGKIDVKELRSVLISGGTIATPTGVSGINDMLGRRISSIIDMVSVVNCEGMGSNKVAYISADTAYAADQTEGSAATAKEPTFDYVTITPDSIAVSGQISKQTKKQSPLDYEAKVNAQALLSLRKAVVKKIVAKLQASTLVDTKAATLDANNKGVIDEKTLRNIVLAYGGDEDVVGGAVLFLNKADLVAFGDVRGTNEKLPVYEITPDGENPNTGTIKDGGMIVKYCICSDLTALAGTAKGASAKKTMFYGDPKCFELDLFSDYEVRVSEDFAFTSLMDTILGDVEAGGDVVVNHGFVTMTINP